MLQLYHEHDAQSVSLIASAGQLDPSADGSCTTAQKGVLIVLFDSVRVDQRKSIVSLAKFKIPKTLYSPGSHYFSGRTELTQKFREILHSWYIKKPA